MCQRRKSEGAGAICNTSLSSALKAERSDVTQTQMLMTVIDFHYAEQT